jgi:PAS domain S-box-containing protein
MISANTALPCSYDYDDVARSVLMAIAASYVALDLAGRVTAARGRMRSAWLSGGAVVMGIGIWDMHLKGMFALHLPVPIEYHWPEVLASLLLAILASALALYVSSRQNLGWVAALTGGVLISAGIAGLHYVMMAAMRLPAIPRYSTVLVICSVLLAVLFSSLALVMAFGLREEMRWSVARRAGGAVVMGAAISAMHYTAMAAATFFPGPAPDLSHAISLTPGGNFGFSAVTLIVLVAALIASSVDRRTQVEVQKVNQDLERRVAERTIMLEQLNQTLMKEVVERKRVEEEVRQSEGHLKLVIDTIPAQIWSGPPDGPLDFCNQQWRSYTGLTLAEIQGEGWQQILHPDDRERVLKAWSESLTKGTPYEQEQRHRQFDGQYRWFLTRGVPLRDSDKRVVRWYGTNTDIDDRKRAEEQLRTVIDTLPALVWSKLPDGSADFLNQRFTEYTGLPVEAGLGWGWLRNAFHPEDRAEEEWRAAFAAGQPFEKEARLRMGDGRYRWFLLSTEPFRDESGTVIKWYGITTDIEDRKRAESALREAEEGLARVARVLSMGELATSIAHEVNQPLTAIVTNGNFLLRGLAEGSLKPEEMRETIVEIVEDGTRASEVISRIRALLQKRPSSRLGLDINELIQEVVVLVRHEVIRNNVFVSLDLASDLPRLRGDPVQLQQVLINLIINSIDAMRRSTAPRKISIRSRANATGVTIQVRDSGKGIEPEEAKLIFEPFYTTKPEGIGLGLSISRSIIESHDGRLRIVPSSSGAIFELTLPVDDEEAVA